MPGSILFPTEVSMYDTEKAFYRHYEYIQKENSLYSRWFQKRGLSYPQFLILDAVSYTHLERDLQAFAKEVREATSGRIDIRIYGSSQLGDYTVVQEKVSLGSVEMSCESVSTQVDKRFLSYILPYVAKDYATAKKNFGTGTTYAKYCANLLDVYKRQVHISPEAYCA